MIPLPEKPEYWRPVPVDIVPGSKCCPEALIRYIEKPARSLVTDVRMHLSFLGWKIEFSQASGIQRFRYTSPDDSGGAYLSLKKVVQDLLAPMMQSTEFVQKLPKLEAQVAKLGKKTGAIPGLQTAHNREFLESQPVTENSVTVSFGAGVVGSQPASSGVGVVGSQPASSGVGVVGSQPASNSSVGVVGSQPASNSGVGVVGSQRDYVFVEPECNPHAVIDWCFYDSNTGSKVVKAGDIILKAKKHMSYMGWVFWYTRKGERRELRYTSPQGITYISLRTACKSIVDEAGGVESIASNLSSPLTVSVAINTEPSSRSRSKKRKRNDESLEFESKLCETDYGLQLQPPKSASVTDLKGRKKRNLKNENYNQPERRKGKELRALKRVRSSKRVRQGLISGSSSSNPLTILSWLIGNNVIMPRSKVTYRNNGEDPRAILQGRITRDGIKCSCCQMIFTLGGFQMHAQGSSNHRPASSTIVLNDGRSLLDCQMQVMRSLETNPGDTMVNCCEGQDYDEICSVCHTGGELLLCDSCPSTFHAACLGLKGVPDGDWFCPSCNCGLCGERKFRGDVQHSVGDEFLRCDQCEHKYHVGCLPRDILRTYTPNKKWFCSDECVHVFTGLKALIGKSTMVGVDKLTWTLLKYSDVLEADELAESYSKLKLAVELMHECFEPVKDSLTGRDLVEDVIFSRGSSLNRSAFQGFYTVILERNEELISAANVRIHGQRVAEVPLISTRLHHRQTGMCRVLMNELEKMLASLGVEKLILPAIPDVVNTWINSFGFVKMTEAERLQYLDCTFLNFPETTVCQKLLPKTPLMQSRSLTFFHARKNGDHYRVNESESSQDSEVSQAEKI